MNYNENNNYNITSTISILFDWFMVNEVLLYENGIYPKINRPSTLYSYSKWKYLIAIKTKQYGFLGPDKKDLWIHFIRNVVLLYYKSDL